MQYISIGEAASMLGVAVVTLRRWEKQGLFPSSYRTFGNHRRYKLSQILEKSNPVNNKRKTIGYARVSSHDQKKDLNVQAERLRRSCPDENIEVIRDLGSGMNYRKPGFKKLLAMICRGQVGQLVLTHKDRLLRFGAEIIFSICQLFNVRVHIIEECLDDMKSTLVNDVIEVMTVFSARLYGSRSRSNLKSCRA